jgi:hypothetical protein
MRMRNSALFVLSLALAIVPKVVEAGGTFVPTGFRGTAYAGGYGYARLYGHPFDDGYDYPVGYGEYAEYGPWTTATTVQVAIPPHARCGLADGCT